MEKERKPGRVVERNKARDPEGGKAEGGGGEHRTRLSCSDQGVCFSVIIREGFPEDGRAEPFQ